MGTPLGSLGSGGFRGFQNVQGLGFRVEDSTRASQVLHTVYGIGVTRFDVLQRFAVMGLGGV